MPTHLELLPSKDRLFTTFISGLTIAVDKAGRRSVFDTRSEPTALDREDVKDVVEQLQEWLHVTAVEAGEEAES